MMRKKFHALLLFFPLFGLPAFAHCQDSDLGNWLIYFGNKQINARWNWHNEAQLRNYNAIGDLEQLLLRTGLGYNLTEKNNNILLGYGYILSQNYVAGTDEKVDVHEHRIFQQFITRQSIERVQVLHRYRFEQRFIEEDFRLRFRYFLSLNIPLTGTEILERSFYASVYNEIFLNTEGDIFDRDRLYGGIGYKWSPNLRFEVGYMNQFLLRSQRDQINLIAFVNF